MIDDDFDIKRKVDEVLESTGFAEQRVAKMDVDDLLKYVRDVVSLSYQSASSRSPGYCQHFTTQGSILLSENRFVPLKSTILSRSEARFNDHLRRHLSSRPSTNGSP